MKPAGRAGNYVQQAKGYSAFIPKPLPPDPPIKLNPELILLLSDADQALARLDGLSSILPNPDLFVAMYVKHEAVLSSQIEGTQSTLEDVLKFDAGAKKKGTTPSDLGEIFNYIDAMNYGLERVKTFPLSLRLIREIHEKLMKNVRGGQKTPGEFRRSQNWIGSRNCPLKEAGYVPPPVFEMRKALDNFEKFLHQEQTYPILIQCGLIHAQFETIHPFLDGNGRVGRLLITFILCHQKILQLPLLYLSHYLKAHKVEYYDRLMAIRNEGDWENWLRFFLKGVHTVSIKANETARKILNLQKEQKEIIYQKMGNSKLGSKLHEFLFKKPFINSQIVQKQLDCSPATSAKLLNNFVELNILKETTGGKRYRQYRFFSYLDLFSP